VDRDPLTLRYTFPLPPEVDLNKYQELRIPYEESKVDDEEVDAAMENIRQRQALIEPADRPAEASDVVVVDIRAELQDPPEEMEPLLLDTKGVELLVEEESDWPIPGIYDQLLGIEAGGERDFEYIFPDDHPTEEIRGQTANFHLICLEVKSRLVPEWTDDLAQTIGDYNDLLDLRIKVRENLDEQKARASESEYAKQVIDATVEGAEISFPPLLLQEEIQDLIHELEGRLRSQNLGLEDYLKIENKSEADLRVEFEPRAIERLKRSLVLGKVVELEVVEVEDEEISAEIDRIVEPFKDQSDDLRKAFDSPEGQRRIRLDLLSEKAIKRLVAIARGELEENQSTSDEKMDRNDTEQGTEEKE
jgi:trigger factor